MKCFLSRSLACNCRFESYRSAEKSSIYELTTFLACDAQIDHKGHTNTHVSPQPAAFAIPSLNPFCNLAPVINANGIDLVKKHLVFLEENASQWCPNSFQMSNLRI